ncbi:PREDICTED: cytochrome P450 2D15-like [Branchiostoma belcheri]|uniref:Steroid 21-hydroxylase n=1 Tax=Branchiostoma belcheri TaxID=7741 RepID=A0A6P4YZE4_BRABE|nr:PREDICTED: cytochrome P450 2D15-like [Branchiostoma belcheri]
MAASWVSLMLDFLSSSFFEISPSQILTTVFCTVLLGVFLGRKRKKNLPPSPAGSWPVVGHLPLIGSRAPYQKLTEWRSRYGDVYSIRMGTSDVVVLNGYRAVREALVDNREVFADRPDNYIVDGMSGWGQGIATTKWSQSYRERRRFATAALKSLGMKAGSDTVEKNVLEEVHSLRDRISETKGRPIFLSEDLSIATANVIASMVFGRRFEYDDSYIRGLTDALLLAYIKIGDSQAINLFPLLRFVPIGEEVGWEALDCGRKVDDFIREEIQRHRETAPSSGEPRDFIDLCLLEIDKDKVDVTSGAGLTEEHMVFMVHDLFFAGIETIHSTLLWGFLYLATHQDIQEKVQAELDSVMGQDPSSDLTLAHRPQLPYTEATLMEVQRIRYVVPLSIPHATAADVTFRGYQLPAGTTVIANLWSIHMDPEYWPDPERFDPERFLDVEGEVINNPDSFLPFSAGRRVCLGGLLAKMELFLVFASLLRHFTFQLPEGAAVPSTLGCFGITMSPRPFQLCVRSR